MNDCAHNNVQVEAMQSLVGDRWHTICKTWLCTDCGTRLKQLHDSTAFHEGTKTRVKRETLEGGWHG